MLQKGILFPKMQQGFFLNGWVREGMVTASENGMVREGKNNGIGHQPRYRKKKLLAAKWNAFTKQNSAILLCERPVPKDNNFKRIAMNWKVLKTEADYNKAAIRMMEIFQAKGSYNKSQR